MVLSIIVLHTKVYKKAQCSLPHEAAQRQCSNFDLRHEPPNAEEQPRGGGRSGSPLKIHSSPTAVFFHFRNAPKINLLQAYPGTSMPASEDVGRITAWACLPSVMLDCQSLFLLSCAANSGKEEDKKKEVEKKKVSCNKPELTICLPAQTSVCEAF
jgi:hypothetical protein